MPTYSDTFAGSGALGTTEVGGLAWEIVQGTWSRSGGKATASDAATANPIAVVNINSGDADINLGVSSGGGDAIYFRVVDAANWLRLRVVKRDTQSTSTYYVTEYEMKFALGPDSSDAKGQHSHSGPYTYWTTESSGGVPSNTNHTGTDSFGDVTFHWHDAVDYYYTGATRQSERQSTTTTVYYELILEKCVAGGVTILQTYSSTSSSNAANTIRVVARGSSISVYRNSVQLSGVTDSTHIAAVRHGIGKGGSSEFYASSIDNFSLTTFEPAVPSALSPTGGSTVTTATPTIKVTLAAFGNLKSKAEWQIASDSAFTANLQTITEPDSAYRASGETTHKLTTAQKLTQRVWYIRARAIAEGGDEVSQWTATNSFTVAHAPGAVNLKPTAGNGVVISASNRFSWEFSDTSETDTQSAYQVIIERNDNAQVILDTGKTLSSNWYHDAIIDAALLNVQLRWKLKVWDSEDKESAWTSYQLFKPSDAPVVTILEPLDGSEIQTSRPTISWDFTASGGRTQIAYRVTIAKQGTGVNEYDSGTVSSTVKTFQPPVPVVQNGFTYVITVYATDSTNITVSAVTTVVATYEEPDPVTFSVDTTRYESLGYVWLTWQSVYDPTFLRWKVYRRIKGETEWTVLAEIAEQNVTEHRDWLVPSMETYQYLVVQVVERFGEEVESYLAEPVEAYVHTGGYWLIDSVDHSNNLRLHNVSSEDYSIVSESADYLIVGRGRHVDEGEVLGVSGTLTAQLRDSVDATARQKKHNLELLKRMRKPLFLRNPFGDIIYLSLGEIQVSRVAGVGSAEFVDVTVPYLEVF